LAPIALPGHFGRIPWRILLLFWLFNVFKLLVWFGFCISCTREQDIRATIACQKSGGVCYFIQKCYFMHTCITDGWRMYIWPDYHQSLLERSTWLSTLDSIIPTAILGNRAAWPRSFLFKSPSPS
jgi:hypothetical protein